MKSDLIYPVPVKPATGINRWGDWPQDVEPVLLSWNSGPRSRRKEYGDHSLSFRRSLRGSIFEPSMSVFKCVDCSEFCEPHAHGAAVLDEDWLCDECLIGRARRVLAEVPHSVIL